ncbi:MAG: metallophosphoesterase [Verrucomicrobiaceae bacterium]|nr:metallophosphoesterase [Verrucomicrobiaceae bacterium]
MKTALFQLSDIHIKSEHDLAVRYLPRIAGVMNELSMPSVDLVIIVLAGDLTYSGKTHEFKALRQALVQLRTELASVAHCEVHFVAIPGNHDCDFSESNQVRDLLIKTLPSGDLTLSDSSIIEQCVTVQKEFWSFALSDLLTKPLINQDCIYLEHSFPKGKETLRLRMYNTAWVSQIHETPGIMGLPKQHYDGHNHKTGASVTISVLHHPTHWFTPNRKRDFDLCLDHSADLVMFGHEHLPEEYIKSDFDGNQVGYIYGGVFQKNPMTCPGQFNVVLIDTERGQQQTRRYRRSGDHFQESILDWVPYGNRSPEIISGFRLSTKQAAYLEDAEIEFVHRSGRALRLEDIYITPDFSVLKTDQDFGKRGDPVVLRGEQFDDYVREKKKILVFGRERSGRTSLCKKVFWTLYRSGIVPIMIHGSKLTSTSLKNAAKLWQESIYDAYDNPTLPAFDQSNSKSRALIIDGFEAAKLNSKQRSQLLTELERKFGFIIVLGDPLMMFEEMMVGGAENTCSNNFSRLEIRELGRSARRRLIRRWFSIGSESGPGLEADKILETERIIDTLLGKSFMPAYPIFILSFLQNIESSRPMDNIGSYGYHYEAFITNALSRHGTQINLDIKYQFLSELAFRAFESPDNPKEIDEFGLKLFHRSYCDKYGIAPSYDQLVRSFLEARILDLHDGNYRFRYAYAYYFFVARYFRDHIDQDSIREKIRALSQSFHVEQNANIWLFLAHLSKSRFLLDTLVNQARQLFSSSAPLTLENDIGFLRELAATKGQLNLVELVVPDGERATDANLDRHYDTLDKLDEANRVQTDVDEKDGGTIFARLDAMIRTIQVLGQVLKNFPGSLTAHEKLSVVEEAFSLGLRGLSFIMDEVESGKDDLVNFIAKRVAAKYDLEVTDREVMDRVREGIFWLLRLNVFGMIKLISQGVGAKGEESTYQRVVEKMNSPAAKLVNVSISLDTLSIPKRSILLLRDELKNDVFNTHLLSSLVAHHFYLFDAPKSIRQELCQKLNISIKSLVQADAVLGDQIKRV